MSPTVLPLFCDKESAAESARFAAASVAKVPGRWKREPDVFLVSGNICKPTSKMAALSEYENAMFLEVMDDDGLFITAK